MKRIILFIFFALIFSNVFANEQILKEKNEIQTRIDEVGINLLNFNRIPKRVVFVYSKEEQAKVKLFDKTITKRQIILYDELYQYIQTNDELAAALAREISLALKSYSGAWGGKIDTLQIALSPKKFEIYADKRAVDYLVNAGYNPLALIVYINKTCAQAKGDAISRHNLTSKRLATIYEYITFKYPKFLKDNEYINNPYYQNFLLTSVENRKKLEHKIQTRSRERVDYE